MANELPHSTQYDIEFGQIRPRAIPTTPVIWPTTRQADTKIQQTKGSAKPPASATVPTTQPSQSVVAPRTTPQHVSNVRVIARPAGSGQRVITVQFTHPSNDPHFAGANVYLKKAGQQPTLVASGSKSPLTFTAS